MARGAGRILRLCGAGLKSPARSALTILAVVSLATQAGAATPTSTPPPPPTSTPPPPSTSTPPPTSTRGRAVLLGGTGGVLAASAAFLPVPAVYRYAMQLASPAPLLASDDGDYAINGGAQAVFVGSSIGFRAGARSDSSLRSLWATSEELSLHQAFYSAYASYRDARARGTAVSWNDSWRPWTADELVLAPVQPRNLKHPIVFASLSAEGGLLGTLVGLNYVVGAPLHPTSSRSFARDLALGTVLAWDAGMTEEAFFRGFYYEELRLSLGKWPARVVDTTTFTLAHVPGELSQNVRASTIYLGLLTRAVGGLLFEMAYDEGGLPASVALHALWDVIAFTASTSLGQGPFGQNALVPVASTRAPGEPVIAPLYAGAF